MSLNLLVRRLRFLPLGLLWGLVASSLEIYFLTSRRVGFLSSVPDLISAWQAAEMGLVPIIGALAGSCVTSIVSAPALLIRNITSLRWIGNWVIFGAASCAGGGSIFNLLYLWRSIDDFLHFMQVSTWVGEVLASSVYAVIVVMFSFALGILIGITCAVVALLLAPLALLGRSLVLRRTSAA